MLSVKNNANTIIIKNSRFICLLYQVNNIEEINKYLDEAKKTYKEQPFYINIPVKELYESKSNEKILVQGIIDLYYITENEEIILVDYKTDYVPENKSSYLKEKYQSQLNLYKRALEQALGKKVTRAYIYSTYLNDSIEVKNRRLEVGKW